MSRHDDVPAYYYIFYTDVVGSSDSRLDLRQQINKLNALNEILGNVLFPNTTYSDTYKWSIKYHASTGDGAVICFQSVIDPFELAINLHRGILKYNTSKEGHFDSEKIEIRIGISGGETLPVCHFDKRSSHAAPWGRDMVMAKRIMDIGYPGHILVSEGTKDQVVQFNRDYKFKHMGEHIVKHGDKVVVYSFLYKDGEHQIGNEDPVYCDCHDNLSPRDKG
ncbi:MAG TPA: adenylate/guanylate cyclase domain-containing protein [Nitrososphaeraceae archaeon]|nr:adenylate/guanylate cyclase domain-containing protein [Nitrososphaeraceae archaeon]